MTSATRLTLVAPERPLRISGVRGPLLAPLLAILLRVKRGRDRDRRWLTTAGAAREHQNQDVAHRESLSARLLTMIVTATVAITPKTETATISYPT